MNHIEAVAVTIVGSEGGDWSGLYVNGILEFEGHQIYEHIFINLIEKYKIFKEVKWYGIKDEHIEANFPYELKEIESLLESE